MVGEIDFSQLKVPDIGKSFMDAYQAGAKRKALDAYAHNPEDPNALNALIAMDPEVGFKAAEHQRRMAEYQRTADTRNALADYVSEQYPPAQRNALASPVQAGPVQSGQGPVSGPAPMQAPKGMPAPTPDQAQGATGQPRISAAGQPPHGQQSQPDLSFLGQPESASDHKFMRLLQIDPKAALQVDSAMRDNMVKRLGAEHQFMDFAASALAGVHDEASYQAAVAEADRRMPEANVRAHVPANYPGPQAIEELRMRSLGTKEQIGALLQASNVSADNARADRNTDSLIATREGQLAETRRYHKQSDGTRRRGQDITATTSRRGQDMRGSGGRTALPTVSSPAEAMKLRSGTKFRTPDGTVRVRP